MAYLTGKLSAMSSTPSPRGRDRREELLDAFHTLAKPLLPTFFATISARWVEPEVAEAIGPLGI
ncbi:MAG: hypothetical protein WAW85_13315 [Gordonia sp. (in: high G+C Gram-positive bacteria)]|uniref:hypothetical protein n=1 Tax=Gordonia sp. (in: high G+C Gram-positive bacteria) TaxID=84139 RepID=UPI003BB54B3A